MRIKALLLLALLPVALAVAARKNEKTGKVLFEQRCSACHSPERALHRGASRDEWREIVGRMRRMPQSGIAPGEAKLIIDYLVSLEGRGPRPAGPAVKGGRKAWGEAWLSILETAAPRDDRVRLGGKSYEVERSGDTVVVFFDESEAQLTLPGKKRPARTLRLEEWGVGKARYEVHLVLYEIRGERIRLARALKKLGRSR